MARTWTLPMALLLASGLAAQSTGTLTVHFPLDEAVPMAADASALRALCDRPEAARITGIVLNGHTDVQGATAYNQDLSERRAEAVRTLLANTCLRDRPVTIAWSGEAEPLSRSTTEPAHAANRRVDVVLTFDPVAATASRADAHPTVRPLMPGIDKPRERHSVDPRMEIDVTMSDGVRVRIPAGAIQGRDGLPVEGPVDLSYRSFSEPYEIIASGIPMHVGTEDGPGHFETAGMYELYAVKGDEQLALAPGAEITLERPGTEVLAEDYTSWRLDPEDGTWAAGGALTTTPLAAPAVAPGATDATALYWRRLWELEGEKIPDTTLFAARRAGGNYCHLNSCDTAAPARSWKKRRDRFDQQAGVPEITVVGYKGIYDPDHIVFTVDMDRVSDRQFPEWRRLPYPAIWEYRGDASQAMFKRLYGRRHKYQDIQLDMRSGEDEGVLRLKENGEWLVIPVSAHWNRDTPARAGRWDRAVVQHDKTLTKSEAQFDKQVTHRTERYRREHRNMPATAWKHAKRAMIQEERPLDLEAWRTYASTRLPVVFNSNPKMQQDLAAVRTAFGLQDFGVYNIDRIMKMSDQQQVLADAVDADGNTFPWVSGFAVLTRENSVITYWGNGAGKGDNFLVSPGRMKSLFLVDTQGRIARADVAPLNSRESRVVLRVELLGDPKDIEALRATAQR